MLIAGEDSNGDPRIVLTDSTGKLVVTAPSGGTQVQGSAADNTPPVGNPVLVAGFDGVNVQDISVDTSGRIQAVGTAAVGVAPTGNPVSVAGVDGGGLKRHLLTDTTGAQVVVGSAAIGATATGSPVPAALVDPSGNIQYLKQVLASNGQVASGVGVQAVGIHVNTNGANWQSLVSAAGLTDANNAALMLPVAGPWIFNGTTFDRWRNNIDVTLLASAARTTTQTSADIITYNLSGITVIVDVTSAGTGSITMTINGKDPASGKYYPLLTGAAIVSNSTNVYRFQPALPVTANKDSPGYLPRVIQIVITANNANSVTYSVGYTLHNP